jgi:hypothetical protein
MEHLAQHIQLTKPGKQHKRQEPEVQCAPCTTLLQTSSTEHVHGKHIRCRSHDTLARSYLPLHIHAVVNSTPPLLHACWRVKSPTAPSGCSASSCTSPSQPGSLPGFLTCKSKPPGHNPKRMLPGAPALETPPLRGAQGLTLPAAAQGPGRPAPSLPGSCTPVCH